MKRWFLAAVFLVLPWSTQAAYWDNIDSYDINLVVQRDGTVDITEVIEYNFGTVAPAHGIERFIPTHYVNGWYNDNIDLRLHSVTDGQGRDWPVSTHQDGINIVWRIGDPDRTLTGPQTYVIDYTANWAMTDYDDYIELYWDAIGTEWTVPMDVVHITVTVPHDSQLAEYPLLCYYGSYASDTQCEFDQLGDTYTTTLYDVGAYNGVTVLAAFAPGSVASPGWVEWFAHWIVGNWSLLLLPLWLLAGAMLWWLARSVRPDKPLIPIYEVPDGIANTSQAEYLLTGKVTDKSFTAELIQAAIRGELIFNYDEHSKKVTTLELTGKKFSEEPLAAMVKTLVFGSEHSVELKKKVVNRQGFLSDALQKAKAAVQQHGWVDSFKQAMIAGVAGYGLVGFIGGGLLISWGNSGGTRHLVVTGVTMLVTGLGMFFIRGRKLPLNVAGANQRRLLEGFKWFLRVTEEERLKFTQAPKLTPKLFEAFLPYAIVFGVEDQWIKQFEDVLQEPPTWLHGANHMVLSSALLSVGHTAQSFKVPASARASGSGFSGGGFSGGGFGGGGGGRW